MRKFLFILAVVLVVALAGCGGGGGGSSATTTAANTPVTGSIGPSGGTVTAQSANGPVSVRVPAGALTATTQITVTPIASGALSTVLPLSTMLLGAAMFDPSGTSFPSGSPAELTLALPSARTPNSTLWLLMLDSSDNHWDYAAQAVVSADGLSATASVNHFSTYALAMLPQGTATLTFANQAHPGYDLSVGQVYDSAFTAPTGTVDIMFEPWWSGGAPAPALVPLGTGVAIQDMGVVSLAGVTQAPTNPTNPGTPYTPVQGHTYAIKTIEGNYALIYCRSLTIADAGTSYDAEFVFDWVYQPNGTTGF
jgi:hypothetical protein